MSGLIDMPLNLFILPFKHRQETSSMEFVEILGICTS